MSIAKRVIGGSGQVPPHVLSYKVATFQKVLRAVESLPGFQTLVTELPGDIISEVLHVMFADGKDMCFAKLKVLVDEITEVWNGGKLAEQDSGRLYQQLLPEVLVQAIALCLAAGQLPDLRLPKDPVVNWFPPAEESNYPPAG